MMVLLVWELNLLEATEAIRMSTEEKINPLSGMERKRDNVSQQPPLQSVYSTF